MNHQKWLGYPGSKWLKHQIMHQDAKVKTYLPETYRLTLPALEMLLKRYPSVYLKPNLGGGGRGVLRIRQREGQFVLEGPSHQRFFESSKQLYRYLKYRLKGRNYIAQQGIQLIQWNGRPMDFRCLLYQKDGAWSYIGTMGKVAAAKSFTTNLCRGGQAVTLKKALQLSTSLNDKQIEQTESKLKDLGLRAAKRLNQYFPYITELGLDIAIDAQQHYWILEANTKPRFELFRNHEDRSLYAKIAQDLKRLRTRSINKSPSL